MNLTLHFLRKDLRRSRLLLGFWLALVALKCAAMAWSLRPGDHVAQATYGAISTFLPFLQFLVLAVLVALVVQEESPAGTTGFWFTRPMPRPAVLRSKAAYALLLLAIPVIAEIPVLAAAGFTRHDLVLAVPEIVLEQLQVIAAAAVLAALTPSFGRFAISGAVAWVAVSLSSLGATWLRASLERGGADAIMQGFPSTLNHTITIADETLIAAGLAGAFAYQFLSRRTGRALAIAISTELGGLAVTNAWHWDFFPSLKDPPAKIRLDTASISTVLTQTSAIDDQQMQGQSNPSKRIEGWLYVQGLPSGYGVLPRAVRTKLTLSTGETVPSRNPRLPKFGYTPSPLLFESATEGAFIFGYPNYHFPEGGTSSGLAEVDADTFRRYAGRPLACAADIDLELVQFVVKARMPLVRGAHAHSGSETEFITDILQDGERTDIILELRRPNLLFERPAELPYSSGYLVYLNQMETCYLLVNQKRAEAVRVNMNETRSIQGPEQNGRIMRQTWRLSFGSDSWAPTPDLTPAWLADAELVEVTPMPVAEFTQSLTDGDFLLNAPNQLKTRIPDPPPTDTSWLTRVSLPKDATKEAAREYVDRVLAVAGNWEAPPRWSTLPEDMLANVGPEHLDVLLEARGLRPQQRDLITTAILRTAGAQNRALVLGGLATDRRLVSLVVKFHWESGCRKVLLDALADQKQDNLPYNWIVAAANLKDPSTYPALKAYLVRSRNRQAAYFAIRRLPGIDIGPTVAAAWKRAQSGPRAELVDAACMAIDQGYPEALDTLVGVLRDNDVSEPQLHQRAMTLVQRYTPARGDATALVAWYDAHKDRLAFNVRRRKFLPTDNSGTHIPNPGGVDQAPGHAPPT